MTRTLILMRHAKSSWDSPAPSDHARPLNLRGQRAAVALGQMLRARGHLPDQILCSSARRTRETCDGLALGLPAEYLDALYHAGPAQMRDVLRQATGHCVLMIGHNPGIADLAQSLASAPPAHPRFADYPTGATLVVSFDIDDWSGVASGAGQVLDFVVPRDLTDGD